MKLMTFLTFAVLLPNLVFASSTYLRLLTSTNDDNDIVSHLGLKLNKHGDIEKLVEKNYQGDTLKDTLEYSLNSVREGLVMYRKRGRVVVDLQSDNISAHNGARLNLNYLYSGITGSYHTEELELVRSGNAWRVLHEGRRVSHAHFYLNIRRLLGPIGISHVDLR